VMTCHRRALSWMSPSLGMYDQLWVMRVHDMCVREDVSQKGSLVDVSKLRYV
jgi:hypothetical protein